MHTDVLWAKARDRGDQAPAYHPLICHLIDVACVAHALWDLAMPAGSSDRVTSALGYASTEAAGAWLAFCAGLHDVGKAAPGFQALVPELKTAIRSAGFSFAPHASSDHALVTAHVVPDLLARGEVVTSADPATLRALAHALGAHHGRFPTPSGLRPRDGGGDEWCEARRELVASLASAVGDGPIPWPPGLSARDHSVWMFLAGLTSVADWIGSSEEHFPYERPPVDLHAYVERARGRARRALDEIGWTGWQPDSGDMGFERLFGFAPREMQRRVISVAERPREAALVIIEAPMGEGKTEAAFWLADRWLSELGQRGCYVAMPTQATANAMFDRFRSSYLANRFPDQYLNLHLLHGQAVLSPEYQQLQAIGEIRQGTGEKPGQGAIVAREWFTQRKRGLLGPFAVGTVDQALLSGMQTRHSFVRLFGLADKVIIFDEVHAFDTYTSRLLDRLLEWLSGMGCRVVLLSATLPPTRRRQLIQAFAGSDVEVPEADYPRITTVTGTGVEAVSYQTERHCFSVEHMTGGPKAIAEVLGDLLSEGGNAAVVCNTVRSAQDTYLALREGLSGTETEVRLFHARYPFAERHQREVEAVRSYGREPGARPHRSVLVATQVIEQSLDLDFDVMVSELAPVDLLLQRSGRMHRHDRLRPAKLSEARLLVLEPELDDDGLPRFGSDAFVYGDYLLLKSWLALRDREHICLPDDVDALIVEVYEGDTSPGDAHLQARLCEAKAEFNARRESLDRKARTRLLPSPALGWDFNTMPLEGVLDEDDPSLHEAFRAMTRYSKSPSVEVVCLRDRDGRLWVQTEGGPQPVDLDGVPSEEMARRLVEQSVRLSGYRVARHFLSQPAPPTWRRNALLRYLRPACFDENGTLTADDLMLRLDPELGIVIDYGQQEEPQ